MLLVKVAFIADQFRSRKEGFHHQNKLNDQQTPDDDRISGFIFTRERADFLNPTFAAGRIKGNNRALCWSSFMHVKASAANAQAVRLLCALC